MFIRKEKSPHKQKKNTGFVQEWSEKELRQTPSPNMEK